MAQLASGKYHLRYEGQGFGGLYATAEGYGQPLKVEPQTPPFVDRQTWELVARGEISEILFVSHSGRIEGGLQGPGPQGPITLGDPSPVRVQKAKEDERLYTISFDQGEVGSIWYVGVNRETRELEVVPIPVIPNPEPAPKWSLVKLD
ncbi:peptidase inhibitor clitocypin domain-containing protein [Ceratobasidium sp. AG-Ba]|nr:peptidase inhibitor clitocypin domain-containing protein [Ceratobasidium sp. AG-Ba]